MALFESTNQNESIKMIFILPRFFSHWNSGLFFMTLLSITFFRLFSVFGLTFILNKIRKELFMLISYQSFAIKLSFVIELWSSAVEKQHQTIESNQFQWRIKLSSQQAVSEEESRSHFVIFWLKGRIDNYWPKKFIYSVFGSIVTRDIPQIHSFLSTCIAIIMFTSFFQGSGIAFLVDWLGRTLKSPKIKGRGSRGRCIKTVVWSHYKDIEKADDSEIEQRQREIIDSDGLGMRQR